MRFMIICKKVKEMISRKKSIYPAIHNFNWYLLAMPSYKALNVNGILHSCRQRWCRKLSFSFPPDICFFLEFLILLKVCMILEIVFLGIANIFEIFLKLLPDIYSLQIAWLLSSERLQAFLHIAYRSNR